MSQSGFRNASCDESQADPWLPKTVIIRSITPEIENVSTYELEFRDQRDRDLYRFHPGQFNMLYLPGAGESAMSISGTSSSGRRLLHTIRVAGNVTGGIARLTPGDSLGLRGPFGTSWPMNECIGRDVILVAGGIGLPPLRPVIHQLLDGDQKFGRLNLLLGARSPAALIYEREYENWASKGFNVHVTVDRPDGGWLGNAGVVTLLLERLQSFDPANTTLMCCGPEIMIRFVAKTACQLGIPVERIHVSTERNMQCAIGLCGHCQLGPKFICRDGPVFRYDLIEPYMKVEGL